MAARESYTVESLAEQSNSTTTLADGVAITLTPTPGKTYLIFATAELLVASTTVKCVAQFINTTDAVTYNNVVAGSGNTGNYFSFAGATQYVDGGSGTPKDFKIQWRSGTAATAVKIKNCRICIIEMITGDQYFESTGSSATNSAAINKINSSFTPASTGDYTLFWVADVTCSTTTSRSQTSVLVGATTYDQNARQPRTTSDRYTQGGVIGLPGLTNSSKTVQMVANVSSAVAGTIDHAKMIFLRHDGFDDAQSDKQDTAQARTNVAYGDVTGGTLTFTPANDFYLFLGGCLQWGGSTSALVGTQLLADATTMLETLEAPDTTTSRGNFLVAWIEKPSNASHTYKYQFKSSISSANFQYGTITALKVGTANGDVNANPTGVAGTGAAGTPTVTADAEADPTTVAGTGAAGDPTVTLLLNVPVTGDPSAGGVGSVTITGDANVAPTGNAGTGNAGNAAVTVDVTVNVTGNAGTGNAGDVTVNITIDGTGNVTGDPATGGAGAPTITADGNTNCAGSAGTGGSGSCAANGGASVTLTGVQASGQAGDVTVTADVVVIPSGEIYVPILRRRRRQHRIR